MTIYGNVGIGGFMFNLDEKKSQFRVNGGKRKTKMRSSYRSLSELVGGKQKSKQSKKSK